MKKVWSILCACAMIIGMVPMVALPASAATSGDFEYMILVDGTVSITDYTGTATNLTIPSKLGGYTVTGIANKAFREHSSLRSLTIPNSVTNIDLNTFDDCSSLISITVSANNTAYSSVGGVLFTKDKEVLLRYPAGNTATSYTIPNSVMHIGDGAFRECSSLKSIAIPNSVTSIGYGAFLGTAYYNNEANWTNGVLYFDTYLLNAKENLSGTHIVKAGTKVIADSAFINCTSLTSVMLPNSVTSIGLYAFSGCTSLQSITIPNGVTSIGAAAFYGCSALKSVVIPDSVKSIWAMTFTDCTSLTDIYYFGTQEQWNAIQIYEGNNSLAEATIHYNCSFAAITAQSATASYASKNQNASVKVTAEGDELSYTWYIKNPGATKYVKSSVKSATYSAKMTPTNSGRYAYCIVKDKYGNQVKSKTFVLRMKATITSQSATAAYAKKGATVSVKVGAAGDGLTYTWYIKNANGTKYSKSSVTSATYKATMNSTTKGRRVYCVVKDKYGHSAKSKTFILREAVSITTQPKSSTTAKGAIAKATVKASGDGLKYTWYIKNAGQTKYTKSSVTKATYSTTMNSKAKNRLVYCVVKDKYGNTVKSKTVQLKMK